jgi:hypothetical protein
MKSGNPPRSRIDGWYRGVGCPPCVVPSANAKHVVKKFGDIPGGPGVQLSKDMHFLGRRMRNALSAATVASLLSLLKESVDAPPSKK